MALNFSLSKNLLYLSKFSSSHFPFFLFFLDDKKISSKIPDKVSRWVHDIDNMNTHSLKQENTKVFSLYNSSLFSNNHTPSLQFISYLKEGEKQSLHINYDSFNSTTEPYVIKNFIYLSKNSSFNWIENCYLKSEKNIQILNFIFMEDNSSLNLLKINQMDVENLYSSSTVIEQKKETSLFSLDINFSSSFRKMDIHSKGEDTFSIIKGLNILEKLKKSHQIISHFHKEERGYSRHIFRNILSGRSKNHTHSKVNIEAQEVDSHQMLRNLILSPYAATTNQPELQVSKDQVKATHGATIGEPNPMEIFYLNTRGLSQEQALQFIIKSWAEQIFSLNFKDIKIPPSIKNFHEQINPTLKPFIINKIESLLKEKKINNPTTVT